MEVKVIKGIECPHCREFIPQEEVLDATSYQCGQCEQIYTDQDEARECCKE